MSGNEANSANLMAILTELGDTPLQVQILVEAGRSERQGADSPRVINLLKEFCDATNILGKTAHRILGHHPESLESPSSNEDPQPTSPAIQDAARQMEHLTFLREHIVSTINVQGVEVWQSLAEDGRPLLQYAEDLVKTDRQLLDRLRDATRS